MSLLATTPPPGSSTYQETPKPWRSIRAVASKAIRRISPFFSPPSHHCVFHSAEVGDVERDRPRDAADGQLDVAPKAVPAVRSVKRQLKVILGWFSTSKKSALRRWASRSHFHAAGRKVPSQGRKAEAVLKQGLGTLGITALLALILATDASAVSSSRQVEIRDDCEPATFNAVVGPGTCVKDGGTTFSEFVDQLIAQGRAPAWRFAPEHLRLAAGGTLKGRNIGGETHTFSEVANFGGGCIGFLNALLGLSPVPECAGFPGGVFGATAIPAGGALTVTLAPGIHRFECLIHPWMRSTVDVG